MQYSNNLYVYIQHIYSIVSFFNYYIYYCIHLLYSIYFSRWSGKIINRGQRTNDSLINVLPKIMGLSCCIN